MSSDGDSGSGIRYRTLLAPRALTDVEGIRDYIARENPRGAGRWVECVLDAIDDLSVFPARCARAPEDKVLRIGLRQQWVGDYRVLFVVDESRRRVNVLHIRHAARSDIDPGMSGKWSEL